MSRKESMKYTGTEIIYRFNKETGEYEEKGFFARHWHNVKEFCKNIWNWIAGKQTQFKNWVTSFFAEPDDQEVILKAAA